MPAIDPIILELRLRADQLERDLRRVESRVGGAASRMKGLLAGVSVLVLAKQFLDVADAAKKMEAQLRLASEQLGTFSKASDAVNRSASDTRSGLLETATVYGKFIISAKALGKTQDDAGRATETFAKSLKIGGASAQEAASATLQFGQALGAGRLGGEEFNAVNEASSRTMRLLADAMGVPQGALKKLAEEGKITSEVLFRALTDTKYTEGIDREFKTLPVTFSDAMQQVHNAAIVTFGAFDRGGQFSTALSTFITDGSDGFADLDKAAVHLGVQIRSEFAGLSDAFQPLLDGALATFSQINASSAESAAYIRSFLSTIDTVANFATDRFNDAAEAARKGAVTAAGRIVPGGSFFADRFFPAATPVGGRVNTVEPFERGRVRSQREGDTREGTRIAERIIDRTIDKQSFGRDDAARIDTVLAELRARRNEASGQNVKATSVQIQRAERVRAGIARGLTGAQLRKELGVETLVAGPRVATTDKKKGPKGPSAETLARAAEAERLRGVREDEAFNQEKADLNQDLLRAKQSLNVAAETVAQYELQEIEAARVRQNAGYQADVADKKLTDARAKELIALNDQVAVARAAVVTARETERKRIDAVAIAEGDLTNARDLANAEGALAETTDDRRKAALRLLDLEFQMERARLDAILASQQATAAEKKIARRRLALLPQMQAAETANVTRDTESSYARYRRELPDTIGEVNDRLSDLKVDAMSRLEDSIVSTATAALGLKGALGDIVGELIRIGIQRKLIGPIADALFGKSDGSSGGAIGGFLSSIFGRASGGYVGPGQTVRVNEQRGGMELLRMGSRGGTVIPLGQASATARQSPTIVQQTFVLDARGGVTTPELLAQMNGMARQAAIEGAQAGRGLAAQDQANRMKPRF